MINLKQLRYFVCRDIESFDMYNHNIYEIPKSNFFKAYVYRFSI